jgi:predicted ester cyclase
MSEDIHEIVEQYGQTWDVGAPPGLIDKVLAADVVDHNPQPGQAPGIEGMRNQITRYQAAFPDLHLSNDDIIISGERAALRWSATGTHEGDQLGVPATDNTVQFTGIDILRIQNGRVVERWGEANSLEVMQQIQAI